MRTSQDGVVLLHGISRTSRSLGKMQSAIEKFDGMADHIVIGASHPWLVPNALAVEQTIGFLRDGRFKPTAVITRESG